MCCDLNETISREWLITNGLGGYAAGTVAGTLTRMQHGLLVASLCEGTSPRLLLAKLDEEVLFDQRTYYLGTNEYRDGTLNPAGFVHLESFRLEEGFPIFTYRLGGIDGVTLEKRIWMQREQNTTYIQYSVLRTSTPQSSQNQVSSQASASWRNGSYGNQSRYNGFSRPHSYLERAQPSLTLTLLPFVAHRPYNQPQYGQDDQHFQMNVHQQANGFQDYESDETLMLPQGSAGCTIQARDKTRPYHLLAIGHPQSQAQFIPTGVWYWHFCHRADQVEGQPARSDLYLPGVIRAKLWPDREATLTIIVTTEEPTTQLFSPTQLHLSSKQPLDS